MGGFENNNLSVSDPQFIVFARESGNGIKINTVNPQFGWHDMLGKVTQLNVGASKPTFATYRGGLLAFKFAASKEEYFTYHIPHDYVAGTDLHLHIHWSHIGALVDGGNIVFGYEITYAKGFNQAPFGAPVTDAITGTASTTQYQHIISELQISATAPSGNQIASGDLEPDGIIIARIEVTTNNITVSGGGVPDPFIHEVDIHYQTTNIGTKERESDFYRE